MKETVISSDTFTYGYRVNTETTNRMGHLHQLTVIELDTTDTTFPTDAFSHSGGCHTIPPFPTVHHRWHFLTRAHVPEI